MEIAFLTQLVEEIQDINTLIVATGSQALNLVAPSRTA